ncbi:retrotransposon hot spot (RHS) protein, partial [Trypanosoma conorhini]
ARSRRVHVPGLCEQGAAQAARAAAPDGTRATPLPAANEPAAVPHRRGRTATECAPSREGGRKLPGAVRAGVENFPPVGAFFFVEAPRRTTVGLQTTTAKASHVVSSTVRHFNDQLAEFFNGWEAFARGLSWEIIYVQRADSVTVHACQDFGNAGDRASAGDERHRTFWDNEVHQHHVAMPHEDAIAVCGECNGFMFSLCPLLWRLPSTSTAARLGSGRLRLGRRRRWCHCAAS